MRKPKSEISYKAQPHPFSYPYQWQAADNKQHEQEMNDKNDIG
jgi:hypothetical protein